MFANEGVRMVVSGGTISYNSANGSYVNNSGGGGIYAYKTKEMALSNKAKIVNNTSSNGCGGGIYLNQNGSRDSSYYSRCSFMVMDSSISNNSARFGGGLYLINILRSQYNDRNNWGGNDNQHYCHFMDVSITENSNTTSSESSLMYVDYVGYIILSGTTTISGNILLGSSYQNENSTMCSDTGWYLCTALYTQWEQWTNQGVIYINASQAGTYRIAKSITNPSSHESCFKTLNGNLAYYSGSLVYRK